MSAAGIILAVLAGLVGLVLLIAGLVALSLRVFPLDPYDIPGAPDGGSIDG